jgi:signal transduction histidine kinase
VSLRARLIVIFALLVALPAGIVALNVAHARRVAGDAVMVDFAGSERMRTFMIAGLAASHLRRPAPEVRARITEELAKWERIWRGLRDGDPGLELKGTDDEGVREVLDEAIGLFREYRSSVLAALEEARPAADPESDDRAAQILSAAFEIYERMDETTRRLQRASEEAVGDFRRAQAVLTIAVGLVGLLAVAGGYRYVLRPLPGLLRAMEAIGKGELGARVSEEGPSEFVTVARAFNAMGSALERTRASLLEHERELAAKNRELEHMSRLKSEFLANMSHELRTPLNAVLGYTALLRRGIYGDVAPRQREPLDGIAETGRHLLELINDVLDLSKIEAGRMEVHLEPVELGPLVAELGRSIEPLVRNKGLEFRLEADPSLPRLLTDGEKVRRVLLNFLSNAIKFTKRGRVALEAAPGPDLEEVSLSVRDTGIGIAPEDLPHVFETFRQVDGSATREYGGTGLGLSISLRLARLLGARIEVRSSPGAGSTFTLVLPRAPRPGAGGEVRIHGRNEETEASPRRR